MRKALLVLVALSLLLVPSSDAASWCVNSTTRAFSDLYIINDSDNVSDITIGNTNDFCPYGCAGGRCITGSEGDTFTLVILFVLIAFGFLYLGLNIHQESLAVLSYLFIPLGIMFMAVAIFFVGNQSVLGSAINETVSGLMYILIMIFVIVISFFLIFITYGYMKKFPYGKSKYGKDATHAQS